jgi:cytochrome c-type biogenesis protein CcmE
LKPKFKFAVGAGIIVVALTCLAWVGARDSKTYYHTIPELSTLQGSARHARIRVGGDVAAGSIAHRDDRVDFILTEQGQTLAVSYVGSDPLPDTFKDGAQCLVEGHETPDGHFVAETIQAKCASKYEAAPGGVLPPANSGPPAASGPPAGAGQPSRTSAATPGSPAS